MVPRGTAGQRTSTRPSGSRATVSGPAGAAGGEGVAAISTP